jgi:ribosomal protein S18 acetylase RimI-like enzyme
MSALSLAAVPEARIDDLITMMLDFNALESIPWTREGGEAALRRLLSDPSLGAVRFVHEGEATVGYFVVTFGFDLEWNGRDAFLTELYLVPDARARGLGGQLMPLVESFASEQGARALHLMVRHENDAAVKLYQRAGFVSPPRMFFSKPLAGRPSEARPSPIEERGHGGDVAEAE